MKAEACGWRVITVEEGFFIHLFYNFNFFYRLSTYFYVFPLVFPHFVCLRLFSFLRKRRSYRNSTGFGSSSCFLRTTYSDSTSVRYVVLDFFCSMFVFEFDRFLFTALSLSYFLPRSLRLELRLDTDRNWQEQPKFV